MKIALAQISSTQDWRGNLLILEQFLVQAARRKATAVLFPENVLYLGPSSRLHDVAKELKNESVLSKISELARRNRIAILIGGYPELRRGTRKVYNTAVWIDARGREIARYRKIHLFDAITPSGKRYRESSVFLPGKKLVTFCWRGVTIGLTICYDLRFPEQFRELSRKGAEWIVVPAAFTRETGRAHWHTLLRARAIENLAFVLAPAQTGRDSVGRETFGHSAVFGPWGEVVGWMNRKVGLLFVDIDARKPKHLRCQFSVLKK
jgi:predicted amidohydrolase